ncbi:hypothetical protein AA313_de0203175 [Arthrobotrys entomopaga]|nr:hypothetical protein AA313_de0203175 [Arthrobotrys entomopaga]
MLHTLLHFLFLTTISSCLPTMTPSSRTETHYNCLVTVNQASLTGSWSIFLFFGTPPVDTSEWFSADNNVGVMAILGHRPGAPNQDRVLSQTLPLTGSLRQVGVDTEGDSRAVVQYLGQETVWGVLQWDPSGDKPKLINPAELRDVKLVVSRQEVQYPADQSQKPTFGEPVEVIDVTNKSYWPDNQ